MMNSFNKHPNRWIIVKELVEPGRSANKRGILLIQIILINGPAQN